MPVTRRDEEGREPPLPARATPSRCALFPFDDHVFFRSSPCSYLPLSYTSGQVMVVQGCDPWSPKALRSAMGATFKAPCVGEASDWEGKLPFLMRRPPSKEGRKGCHDACDSFRFVAN